MKLVLLLLALLGTAAAMAGTRAAALRRPLKFKQPTASAGGLKKVVSLDDALAAAKIYRRVSTFKAKFASSSTPDALTSTLQDCFTAAASAQEAAECELGFHTSSGENQEALGWSM